MYFPVWWNCISPWISSCRLCGRWCRAECVLSGGTTRPKGSSHFALQKAAVLGTSTCIYLTAARNMGTSIYPLKSILVQKPLQRDFPNYREISQITERFTKLQRAFFPKLSKLYFPVWSNCISSEVRVDIHQWVCSIKRLGWWLQSGPPSSCQCRGCQGPGLLGGRTPVSPVESLPHPEHNQPTGGSGKSTWNKWKGPQIPLRAGTT